MLTHGYCTCSKLRSPYSYLSFDLPKFGFWLSRDYSKMVHHDSEISLSVLSSQSCDKRLNHLGLATEIPSDRTRQLHANCTV